MVYAVSFVFDCQDVDRMATFWLAALEGYDLPGSDPDGPPGAPPAGFATWEDWADANGIPEHLRYQSRTIIDTTGTRPDIFFMAVPEDKVVKNRVHLDIRASRGLSPEEGRARQDAEAKRLVDAGATVVRRVHQDDGGSHLVLQDVEGNEFCIT
ncbi:VOC family protein [Phytoactinopolyspora halotolerans]|uniref:VOC family protein n=2 Tax=Phytoactinopolyspora halotolerans TaxID=1981512 RepID=A0A6L9SCY5_9ACTN|nr:VOC family protein [Phytoactinopolyspora halotolerans]